MKVGPDPCFLVRIVVQGKSLNPNRSQYSEGNNETFQKRHIEEEEPMIIFNKRPSVWTCMKTIVWETVCEYFSPLTGWERPEAGYAKKRLP